MAIGILVYDMAKPRDAAMHTAAADVESWCLAVWEMHDWLCREINREGVSTIRAAALSSAIGELNRLLEKSHLDLEALA